MQRHWGDPLTVGPDGTSDPDRRHKPDPADSSPRRKLAAICISTVMVMAGQGVISPVLPLYASAFGVSTVMVGATVTAFGLARLVTNIPAGLFADRRGRRALLVGGPIILALGMTGSGLAESIWVLLVFRFVAGFGSGLYMTGAQIYLLDIAPENERGRFIATNQAALLIGVGAGPAIGGVLAARLGLAAPFLVVAAAGAATAVYSFLALPETRTPSSTAEKTENPGPSTQSPAGQPQSRRALFLSAPFLAIAFVSFSVFSIRAGVRQTLVPLQLDAEFGLGVDDVGFLFTALGAIGLVLIWPAGWAADHFRPATVIVPTGLLVGLGMLVVAGATSIEWFIAGLVASAIGSSVTGPAPAAFVAGLAPQGEHGSAMGMYRTAGDLGVVISPVLGGWLADAFSPAIAIGSLAGLMVTSAAVFPLAATSFGRRNVVDDRELRAS